MKTLSVLLVLAACGTKSPAPAEPTEPAPTAEETPPAPTTDPEPDPVQYDPADCDDECDACMDECLTNTEDYDCEGDCFPR